MQNAVDTNTENLILRVVDRNDKRNLHGGCQTYESEELVDINCFLYFSAMHINIVLLIESIIYFQGTSVPRYAIFEAAKNHL